MINSKYKVDKTESNDKNNSSPLRTDRYKRRVNCRGRLFLFLLVILLIVYYSIKFEIRSLKELMNFEDGSNISHLKNSITYKASPLKEAALQFSPPSKSKPRIFALSGSTHSFAQSHSVLLGLRQIQESPTFREPQSHQVVSKDTAKLENITNYTVPLERHDLWHNQVSLNSTSEDCQPLLDWQTISFPTCNMFHEIHMDDEMFDVVYLGEGTIRNVWDVTNLTLDRQNAQNSPNVQGIVLKTLR